MSLWSPKKLTCLSFLQVLTEYVLVSVTSAVTVTIAGVVKEAVTIVVNYSTDHESSNITCVKCWCFILCFDHLYFLVVT